MVANEFFQAIKKIKIDNIYPDKVSDWIFLDLQEKLKDRIIGLLNAERRNLLQLTIKVENRYKEIAKLEERIKELKGQERLIIDSHKSVQDKFLEKV